MSLGPDCAAAGVVEAKWEAKDAAGNVMNKAFFNRNEPTRWPLFGGVTLGVWSWQPTGARGAVDPALAKTGQTPSAASGDGAAQIAAEVPQNTPTTTVRVMSAATFLSVSQTQPCVLPLKAYGTRYNPASDPTKSDGMAKYEGGRGSFQKLERGSTTWVSISGATLPASGQLQINIPWPKITTHYRFVLYDTTTAWGSISQMLTYDPTAGC
ncbi:hypothetical protein ACIA49_01290 [Kribbella sp. NPDC051587]|uniref:hypothetical protein n=1 Tax=Kribbella sp. NPDC051587 TaxID=3364119 RepID=UPI0037B346C3